MTGELLQYALALTGRAAYVWAVSRFCREELKGCKINRKLFAMLLLALYSIVSVTPIPFIVRVVIKHAGVFVLLHICMKDGTPKKLLAAAVLILTEELAAGFGGSFFCMIFLICTGFAGRGEHLIFGAGMNSLFDFLSYGAAVLWLRGLKKCFDSVFSDKPGGWYRTLSLPLTAMIMTLDLVNWGASRGIMVMTYAGGSEPWDLYRNMIFSHGGNCIFTALTACMYLTCLLGADRLYGEQKKRETYFAQLSFYKMLEKQYLGMERLRHDIKNHLLALQGLWQNREWEKMGVYMEHMTEAGELSDGEETTGNRALDALLHYKRKQAEEQGIAWECSAELLREGEMDDFDLCTLLGNILDNAINACGELTGVCGDNARESRRFVEICLKTIKRCLLLQVSNGTCKAGLHAVKKGIGLKNVEEIVEKYNGTMEMKIEDGVFCMSVLLPVGDLRKREKDGTDMTEKRPLDTVG